MDFRTKSTLITIKCFSDIDVSRAESALERAKVQLAADAPDLNRPQVEAALARVQNRSSLLQRIMWFMPKTLHTL